MSKPTHISTGNVLADIMTPQELADEVITLRDFKRSHNDQLLALGRENQRLLADVKRLEKGHEILNMALNSAHEDRDRLQALMDVKTEKPPQGSP